VRRQRFDGVDSLRGLAALSVIAYHVSFSFRLGSDSPWAFLSQRLAGPPIPGVVLFFLISGFVLYRPFVLARLAGRPLPPLLPYAIRRAARILPAYWVALALVTAWLGLHEVMSLRGAVTYFGFLQLYSTNPSTVTGGIGPAWTLCVEVTFYALLPLLALSVRRIAGAGARSTVRSELTMCAALALVAVGWEVAIPAVVPVGNAWWGTVFVLWWLPGCLDLFAAGMALAVLSASVELRGGDPPAWLERAPWVAWMLAAISLYGASAIQTVARPHFTLWWLSSHELKALGAAMLLVPAIFGTRGGLRRVLASRPLVWLGTISYGIYLWHLPIFDKFASRLVPHGQVVTTLVVTCLTLAAASASFYLVERPAQRLARAYLRRRVPAQELAIASR